MDKKTCTVCNIEKHINKFYEIHPECKVYNIKEGVKRYYDNKDKISNQQKIYHEKNRNKLLQKQNDHRNKRNTDFEHLHRSYVESENKLEALKTKIENNSLRETLKYL